MGKLLDVNKVFEKIEYQPHEGQRKIHNAAQRSRFRVVDAGRRTGKSKAGGSELVAPAYQAYFKRDQLDPHDKRMEYWIVGPEYSDAEKEFRVLYNALKKLGMPFDHPGTYNNPLSGDMHISLWDGRYQVHAKSAKYPDNLVGEALHGVILAEAAKLKPSIWTKYIRPMLADYKGWALMSSTPEGKNWFYDAWMLGNNQKAEASEWWSIKMPSWANNIIFPGGRMDPEIRSMEADLTEEAFNQEIGAEFTDFVGRVFKNFDEVDHVKPLTFNPEWETYACVDYPFVWLLIQVDHWKNVYVLGEIYGSHKRVDEVHTEIISAGLCPPQLRYFYPDPAEPGDTRILEENLRIQSVGGTGGEIKDRLRLIRKHLEIPRHLLHLPDEHKDKKPKLFIDPSCKNTIREMNDYRYPTTKNEADRNDSELPMKKDDHAPEALGRFFRGYFGGVGEQGAPVVVSSSMG
jgi:hypothetical protein